MTAKRRANTGRRRLDSTKLNRRSTDGLLLLIRWYLRRSQSNMKLCAARLSKILMLLRRRPYPPSSCSIRRSDKKKSLALTEKLSRSFQWSHPFTIVSSTNTESSRTNNRCAIRTTEHSDQVCQILHMDIIQWMSIINAHFFKARVSDYSTPKTSWAYAYTVAT